MAETRGIDQFDELKVEISETACSLKNFMHYLQTLGDVVSSVRSHLTEIRDTLARKVTEEFSPFDTGKKLHANCLVSLDNFH